MARENMLMFVCSLDRKPIIIIRRLANSHNSNLETIDKGISKRKCNERDAVLALARTSYRALKVAV